MDVSGANVASSVNAGHVTLSPFKKQQQASLKLDALAEKNHPPSPPPGSSPKSGQAQRGNHMDQYA